jgi:hypothetical protein
MSAGRHFVHAGSHHFKGSAQVYGFGVNSPWHQLCDGSPPGLRAGFCLNCVSTERSTPACRSSIAAEWRSTCGITRLFLSEGHFCRARDDIGICLAANWGAPLTKRTARTGETERRHPKGRPRAGQGRRAGDNALTSAMRVAAVWPVFANECRSVVNQQRGESSKS